MEHQIKDLVVQCFAILLDHIISNGGEIGEFDKLIKSSHTIIDDIKKVISDDSYRIKYLEGIDNSDYSDVEIFRRLNTAIPYEGSKTFYLPIIIYDQILKYSKDRYYLKYCSNNINDTFTTIVRTFQP